MPEAAVDVALVGPDEEPDGYGRLELQTAHRLCPNTWISKYRSENLLVPTNASALSHHVLARSHHLFAFSHHVFELGYHAFALSHHFLFMLSRNVFSLSHCVFALSHHVFAVNHHVFAPISPISLSNFSRIRCQNVIDY